MDVRSKEDFERGHVFCAQHFVLVDGEFVDEFGFEFTVRRIQLSLSHPLQDHVLVYSSASDKDLAQAKSKIEYFINQENVKYVIVLDGGYEAFESTYPFLSDPKASHLIYPSQILDSVFLGSSICKNPTVLENLKITYNISCLFTLFNN